jgi:Uncharacterized protein related to plant photosystem II stability/assembly factor
MLRRGKALAIFIFMAFWVVLGSGCATTAASVKKAVKPASLNSAAGAALQTVSNYATTPYFISSGTGYLCLQTSYNEKKTVYSLLKTADGGKDWSLIENTLQLDTVAFADAKTGYGIQNSALVKTSDGGSTWKSVKFFKNKKVSAVKIVNSNVLFALLPYDSMQGVYRTENDGADWTQVNLPKISAASFFLEDMSWPSANQGYAYYGGDGGMGSQEKAVYYTSDAGKNWAVRSQAYASQNGHRDIGALPFAGDCTGIRFFSNGTGYIGGGLSSVMKSTDGGVHFSEMFKNSDQQFDSGTGVPDFITRNEGYALFAGSGGSNCLEHTTNGGSKWTRILSVDEIAAFAK